MGVHYKMRGRDPDCSVQPTFRTWVVDDTPDLTGALYAGARCGATPLVDIEIAAEWTDASTPGSSGAPGASSYVVASLLGAPANARRLAAGAGITIFDNGAGDNIEISTSAVGPALVPNSAAGPLVLTRAPWQVVIQKYAAAAITIRLPPPGTSVAGDIVEVKAHSSTTPSTKPVTVEGNGATIDGQASWDYDDDLFSIGFRFDGTEWGQM